MMKQISDYLNKLYPDAKCELNYNKDHELLISVMLSAQTTDKRVNEVTSVLYQKYPNLESLAGAEVEDIKNIIRPIGTFNKKAVNVKEIANRLIKDKGGIIPNDRTYLETLPGVGRKTVNVVLANIYNEPLIAVDTHVERVSKRLNIAADKDDVKTVEKKLNKKFPKEELNKLHHQLVLFGRYNCKAMKPDCLECELKTICKYFNKKNK